MTETKLDIPKLTRRLRATGWRRMTSIVNPPGDFSGRYVEHWPKKGSVEIWIKPVTLVTSRWTGFCLPEARPAGAWWRVNGGLTPAISGKLWVFWTESCERNRMCEREHRFQVPLIVRRAVAAGWLPLVHWFRPRFDCVVEWPKPHVYGHHAPSMVFWAGNGVSCTMRLYHRSVKVRMSGRSTVMLDRTQDALNLIERLETAYREQN